MGRPRTLLGQKVNNSAEYEETVDISSTDYTPSGDQSFSAVYVGVAGDVITQDMAGNNHTHKAALGGMYHPFAGQKIVKTGTTATDMLVALNRTTS